MSMYLQGCDVLVGVTEPDGKPVLDPTLKQRLALSGTVLVAVAIGGIGVTIYLLAKGKYLWSFLNFAVFTPVAWNVTKAVLGTDSVTAQIVQYEDDLARYNQTGGGSVPAAPLRSVFARPMRAGGN